MNKAYLNILVVLANNVLIFKRIRAYATFLWHAHHLIPSGQFVFTGFCLAGRSTLRIITVAEWWQRCYETCINQKTNFDKVCWVALQVCNTMPRKFYPFLFVTSIHCVGPWSQVVRQHGLSCEKIGSSFGSSMFAWMRRARSWWWPR